MVPSPGSVPKLSQVSSCQSPLATRYAFWELLAGSLDCVYSVGDSAAVTAPLLSLLVAG